MNAYTIIEQSCIGKNPDAFCEDGIVVSPYYIAVIDGSTSKGNLSYGIKTSGRIAMELLSEAIPLLPIDIDVTHAITLLTRKISEYYVQHDVEANVSEHPENRLTASCVIYSVKRNEIWQIGDCPFMLDDQMYDNPKYWEQPLAQMRALFLEKELKDGKNIEQLRTNDTGREYILPLLKFSTRYQNNEDTNYGYAVLDGFPIPTHHIKTYSCKGIHQIILASDGYFQLAGTLNECERINKEYLAQDPLCMLTYKMTKGLKPNAKNFDDRTYIRFTLD